MEVLVEAASSNYTCGKGYFHLDQVYHDSCVFDPPHRRLNKFEREINKAARKLCEEDGRLLLNPVKQLKLTLKFVPNLVAISQATTAINRGAESAPPPPRGSECFKSPRSDGVK